MREPILNLPLVLACVVSAVLVSTPAQCAGQLSATVADTQTLSGGLAQLEPILGTWEASGDGFRTVLTYRAGVTGRVVHAENVVFGAGGSVLARYEGWYVDGNGETLDFETLGAAGEVHRGHLRFSDGGRLWHDAVVTGGAIDAYRSVVQIVDENTLEYRAVYSADVSSEVVLAEKPLIYRRAVHSSEPSMVR